MFPVSEDIFSCKTMIQIMVTYENAKENILVKARTVHIKVLAKNEILYLTCECILKVLHI